MKSADEIKKKIVDYALSDERVRGVLLTGSRANPNSVPDKFQDYDVVFIVKSLDSFTSNHNWLNFLGNKIIFQHPEEMTFGIETCQIKNEGFHYLMIFEEYYRIDLYLFPLQLLKKRFPFDSLTLVWLDKDELFLNIPKPNESDYYIKAPIEKDFIDTCNEFWWVATYVGKGLCRNEITYAKEMMETIVRKMFMKMIAWKIGSDNNFLISFGVGGRHIKKYMNACDYNRILETYSDFNIENNWNSLFKMTSIFAELSNEIATKLAFTLNKVEQINTQKYLRDLYKNSNLE